MSSKMADPERDEAGGFVGFFPGRNCACLSVRVEGSRTAGSDSDELAGEKGETEGEMAGFDGSKGPKTSINGVCWRRYLDCHTN